MGVIRNLSNINDPFATYIEDVLEQILEENADVQQQQQQQQEIRRTRRTRHRIPVVPQATESARILNHKSGKKHRRAENASFLMSLSEGDENQEVTIYDFIPESVSVFTQLLMERENMEAWNNFISRNEDEQWQILEEIDQGQKVDVTKNNECNANVSVQDSRITHPAFSAEECFRQIDSDLRTALKKKHVPLGTLAQLEEKISTFFQKKPAAIYKSQLSSSFERLMVHALCQYMSLYSKSYNEGGTRWTKVRNNHHYFQPPAVMLSAYLERKSAYRWCGM